MNDLQIIRKQHTLRVPGISKTEDQLACMRQAGRAVAQALEAMRLAIVAGERSTLALDAIAWGALERAGAKAAFKDYRPPFSSHTYPYHTCISVNEEIVHGLPSITKSLQDGDIVSLDLGAVVSGWYADAAITVGVGQINSEAHNLLLITQRALKEGIKAARIGGHVGDIGAAIGEYLKRQRHYVCEGLTGHGIGQELHELPQIPNTGVRGHGDRLRPGMTICIEPMVAIGTAGAIGPLEDNWTISTADGSLAAHFEHTVLLAEQGPEILTNLE